MHFSDAWVFNCAREGVSRIFGKEASSEPHRTSKQRQRNLAKHLSDIRELIWFFLERGDLVVSIVTEVRAIEAPIPPVDSPDISPRWLGGSARPFRRLCFRSRSLAELPSVRCKTEHRKKASFVLLARVFLPTARRVSGKRIRAYCDREEGQRAPHRRRTHIT